MPSKDKEKNKEYQKKWYQNNKEKQILRNKNNKRKKFEFIKNYKKERGCSRCDENHVACLQFHHKNPKDKIDKITNLINYNLSIQNILKEIDKCEILCANCHFKLHYEEKNADSQVRE